ncbi:MAG: helix-turn-helix domain-containing protein [Candidatus Omnitrophica bacterium]|nr:helix-turn-helix domain-containing protein [Candidatus Omnitrophota bacterium]
MSEKLLNTREVSQYLGIPEHEIKVLVERGELPAYRLGGTILRFKKDQIDEIKARGLPRVSSLDKEAARPISYTRGERIRDFFYFWDFYIIAVIITIALLVIIFYY